MGQVVFPQVFVKGRVIHSDVHGFLNCDNGSNGQTDYIDKAHELLEDLNTCRPINKDSTSNLENKLAQTLRDIKAQEGISDHKYKRLYCTSTVPPRFYRLPTMYKICTSSGYLFPVGVPLPKGWQVGQSPHHINNTPQFVDYIHKVKLEPGEVITSYDIKALFTSVPVDPSITIVQQKLKQDPLLSQTTSTSIPQIVTLLEFCLKNTYYLFQGKYYKQVHGAAVGSPINSLMINLFMEEFEVKAINCAPSPCLWIRFVDDTIIIQQAEHTQQLLQHINLHYPYIQFTTEEPNRDGCQLFLDRLVSPGLDNILTATVCRKPTHTNQYLHWDSNHSISAKNSIFNTLVHRAMVIWTNQSSLQQEK